MKKSIPIFLGLLLLFGVVNIGQSAYGGPPLISQHVFVWTDPDSQGQIEVTENVFLGCSDGHPNEYTFAYTVQNLSYEPDPGNSNGLSGWQLIFDQSIMELHNQMSPATGGPWMQNFFSGIPPPSGAEWDVTNTDGNGILVGQSGTFSFCTFPRQDIVVNDPPAEPLGSGPNGWAHTWITDVQFFLFNGPNSIPGDLIRSAVGGELVTLDSTMVLAAGAQYTAAWMIPVIVSGIGFAIVIARKF